MFPRWLGRRLGRSSKKFSVNPAWRFNKATEPRDLSHLPESAFKVAVALETLEHVPPGDAGGYLAELARVTNGYLAVSVPNEKGAVSLAKYFAKKSLHGASEGYSPSEVFNGPESMRSMRRPGMSQIKAAAKGAGNCGTPHWLVFWGPVVRGL